MATNSRLLYPFLESHSPHPESSLEWWYVHGWLDGPDFHKRPFMISFFRHKLRKCWGDAFSLLFSLRDKHSKETFTKSWITPSLISQTLERSTKIRQLNLNQMFLDSFLEEFALSGPPREIAQMEASPEVREDQLHICWEDFSLQQTASGFELSFQNPSSSESFSLRLEGKECPVNLKKAFYPASLSRKMDYLCHPWLQVTGESGDSPVSGHAWLDHQWGEHAWFLGKNSEGRVLGWDFFAFCLDDSNAVSIIIHRDSESGKVCGQSATRIGLNGEAETTSEFSAVPSRYWESPSSGTSHPLEWNIVIPSMEIEFSFRPEYENQEIPVFGLQRTIWQGSGLAEGNWKGLPFQSRARGEFQGYGFIHDPDQYLKKMADRIDRHIADFFPEKPDRARVEFFLGKATWEFDEEGIRRIVADPVWALLSRKGKRWRPIFAILLLQAMGTEPQPFEALVSTLAELSHTGSLIIDDIQDSSPLRRGKESIHILYGQEAAICAANTLYFLCSRLLFGHPGLDREQQLDIHEAMMKQFTRAHFGQAQDLFWSANLTPENLESWIEDSLEDKILQMYELKTSSPVEGLAEAASIINRSSNDVRQASINYARFLGVAFQIIDDILNFSHAPGWRKDPAEDIAEGKITYVILRAMQALGSRKSRRLKEIVASRELRTRTEFRREAALLVRESGVFLSCRDKALSMLEEAWQELSRLLEPSHPKILLRMMDRKLINIDTAELEK